MSDFEDKVSLLIPAYINGTLSPVERKEVEEAMEQNSEIAADVAFQMKLRETVKTNREDTHMPGDLGWAKLSKAMQDTDTSVANDNRDKKESIKFWRYAAAILAVATIAQAGIIGSSMFSEEDEVQYVTVTDATQVENSLKLAFNSAVSVNDMNDILLEVEGQIIAGPSKLGLYEIGFMSQSACDTAVQTLKQRTQIVETVTICN